MQLKRILHIADIHIFKSKRHDEHRHITDKLAEFIAKNNIDLIYIGGDVVDSKTSLSPKQVKETIYFFQTLADLKPIVLIPGNHDLIISNKNELDSLTPIVEVLKTTNPIHYLKKTGIYELYDINWAVWSCIDDLNPFDETKVYSDKFIIGCYHAPVKGCTTDLGFSSFPNAVSIDIFEKTGNTFLGDIHKQQLFRDNEIGYPGGICDTKVDEGDKDHGGFVWEWNGTKYVPEAFTIDNPYGFKTIKVDDITTFDYNKLDYSSFRSKNIRLLYTGADKNYSNSKFNELKKNIQSNCSNHVYTQVSFIKNKQKSVEQKNTKQVQNYLKTYLQNEGIDTLFYPLIEKIDTAYDKQVNATDYEVGEYYIDEIEIHNFLCYGPHNKLSMSDLQGLVGLFGSNGAGKSSFLSSIMFCLFNKCPKDVAFFKLINDQLKGDKLEAFVKLKLTIKGSEWTIKRTITANMAKGTSKIGLEVFENVNGVWEERHQESRPKTDVEVLRPLLGDESTFLRTVFWEQKNSTEFVDAKNNEKLDLFTKFIGISIYDEKFSLVSEDVKEQETQYKSLKVLQSQNETIDQVNDEIKIIDKKNEANVLEIKQLEESIQTVDKISTKAKESIENLHIYLLATDADENKLSALQKTITAKELELSNLEGEYKSNLGEWDLPDMETWKPDYTEYEANLQKKAELTNKLKQLEQQADREICPTCKQKWEVFDPAAIQLEIEAIKKQIVDLSVAAGLIKATMSLNSELKQKCIDGKQKIELIQSNIEVLKQKEMRMKQELAVLEENKSIIKKRNEIEEIISGAEAERQSLQRSKITLETQCDFNNKEIKKLKEKLASIAALNKQVEDLESNLKWLLIYKSAMHRTGVPSLILESYIPMINQQLNDLLNGLFDFKIQFELTDSEVNIYFLYKDHEEKGKRLVAQACGMEGIIINLAIRAVLTKISLLPKPSMLMLDEIFAQLDKANLTKMKDLVTSLKSQYYNIIMISHVEDMQDFPEHFITLKKQNDITSIIN